MKNTKRALLLSALALVMCVAMLMGSTFAWFTDSVTSAGNIIKSGTLDVTMEWANGKEAPASANWQDAADGAIFNSTLWEPGYTEARHIKIANKGTLALNWKLAIVANGEVSDLGDVIDVYFGNMSQIVDRDVSALKYVGTLTEWLSTGIASGSLEAGKEYSATLVLKMREEAGNEYQDLAIGTDFAVQLIATQKMSETDSFDNKYDEFAGKTVVTTETAQAAIWAAQEGDVIYLQDGFYGDLVIENANGTPKKGLTIEHKTGASNNGTAFSVSSINLNSSENITIRGIYFDVTKGTDMYKKDGTLLDYKAGIAGAKSGAATGAKNIVIDDCTFAGTKAVKDYVAIYFEEQGRPTNRATDITVTNCSVENSIFNFIRANYLAEGTIVVKNNKVFEETYHSALNLTGNAADIIVRNNTFGTKMISYVMSNGWNPDKAMLGTSRQGSNHINIEVTGNTFIQELNAEGHVIDLKSSYNQENTTLVFENNTYVGISEANVPCIWH